MGDAANDEKASFQYLLGRLHFDTHVWLRTTQLKLNQTDPCLLHSRRPTRTRNDTLVQGQAFHQFGIINRTPNLLNDPYIAKIDI